MRSKLAIFASGHGTNARRLLEYFDAHRHIEIDSLYCNRRGSAVHQLAEEWSKKMYYLPKSRLEQGRELLEILEARKVDWVILAGFLLRIPPLIVQRFENKIINIHPALLPKFGGEGMFGDHVHRAVLARGEKKSGISIHYVDENYDTGSLIAQFECAVLPEDDVETLKKRVQGLEHKYFPSVIEELILESSENRIQ